MFLKFQNKQQRFFYLLTTAVFISVVMVIWSYAWSKYFDLGANESREAVEIAGLSLLLQFFLCLPYFCFKRYIFTSLAITSIINGVYLYLYLDVFYASLLWRYGAGFDYYAVYVYFRCIFRCFMWDFY